MRNESARLLRLGPDQIAEELDRRCSYCGALIIPSVEEYSLPWRDETRQVILWPNRHGCQDEGTALAREAEEREQLARQRRRELWLHTLDRAGLVGWLGEATFDNFILREDWTDVIRCKEQVVAYTRLLLDGELTTPWLILYGGFGTGKSHLAAAIVRQAMDAGWRDCYFRVWTDYLRRLQASWRRNQNGNEGEVEADIVAELQKGRLAVIDDLDKRPPTGWTREVLFTVLNHRYNAQLPTVLTFNYGPDDADPKSPGRLALEEYLGHAVLDRLIGAAFDVVEFDGPSYRSGVLWKGQNDGKDENEGSETLI